MAVVVMEMQDSKKKKVDTSLGQLATLQNFVIQLINCAQN